MPAGDEHEADGLRLAEPSSGVTDAASTAKKSRSLWFT
jgi:hypothetical protein